MIIKAANLNYKLEIMKILKAVIDNMKLKGLDQWDDMYPDEDIILEDINKRNLYIYVDEKIIKAIVTLNEDQAEEYSTIDWKYNLGKQLIIHRLCVDPKYQGKGIARILLEFAEDYARKNNYDSIRLDAFTQNKAACSLYSNNGYEQRGTVNFRKGKFYCFEKLIKA